MSSKSPWNRLRVMVAGCVWGICVFGQSITIADDESVESPEPLTVRDAGVYLLSAYGTNLNDRGLFQSTLPGYTLSRRPSASRKDSNTPSPVSLITFSGPPMEDVDVLLEFDNGRFLSHWPPARMRSKRLLWASLSVSVVAPETPARMPEGHWLSLLRDGDRLYESTQGRCDRALLYDAELKFAPHVKLERSEANFRVKNSGEFPVHDLFVYRPTVEGKWDVWSVETVDRSNRTKKAAVGDSQGRDRDAAENIFDDPVETDSTSDADATDGIDSEPAEGGDSSDEPAVVRASDEKKRLADLAAKVESGELLSNPETEDSEQQSATADAAGLGTMSSEEALQVWTQRLRALGLGDVETKHITTILKTHALRPDATMLVYRMNEAHLEKLLPLEVTPYPDRLFRVALVIVQDADPDLQSRIDQLVRQLGNDEWSLRVAAQGELQELGLAAKPKLEEALKSEDVEVVFRAEQLLERIQSQP